MRWRALFLICCLAGAGGAPANDAALERAKKIVSGRCFLCHGAEGESTTELYPRLAGQHPRYLEKQLRDFRDGRRKGGGMEKMAEDLKDDDIAALAAYFSARKAAPHRSEDPVLASTGRSLYMLGRPNAGLPSCASCHGPDGAGTDTLPRLAGQLPGYLMRQLKHFSSRARTNDNEAMHQVAAKLSDVEIKALAEYLGELE